MYNEFSSQYYLFLDDERDVKHVTWLTLPKDFRSWVVVRNYDEFVKTILMRGLPIMMSLDHDLKDEHYPVVNQDDIKEIPYDTYKFPTGLDCAKWLCDYCLKNRETFPKYTVHSMNRKGKENIIGYISGFLKQHNMKMRKELY